MRPIELKGLAFTRLRNWLKRADDCLKQDPVSAFIFAWISFNHYYATFAVENSDLFRDWRKKYCNGKQGDKVELLFLINSQEFSDFFADYRKRCPQKFNSTIELPIIDMLKDNNVPDNISGRHALSNLSNEDVFKVIYQIRNNLFHGSKDPMKVKRDLELCITASEFLVPLVADLLISTNGEVVNTSDEAEQELRAYIQKMAKD